MRLIVSFFIAFLCSYSIAQVGIGTQHPQSALDIASDTMGITVPRVDGLQHVVKSKNMQSPLPGTIVFNLQDSCFYGFNGKVWRKFAFMGDPIYPVNQPPQASISGVTGQRYHNQTITLTYAYSDAENDPEGNSKMKWFHYKNNVFTEDVANASGQNYLIDTTIIPVGDSIYAMVTPVAISGDTVGITDTFYVGTVGHIPTSNNGIVLAYFPSWSENTPTGNSSNLRDIPTHLTHVFLAFAKPNLTYTSGSYDISDTGIEVPYDGCTLAESIAILTEKGLQVILSIGGETYWASPQAYNINYQQIKNLVDDLGLAGIDWDYEPNGSFADIGTATNINHFIDFFVNSRAIMPAGSYTLACAPSGVGCLGGITNDDPGSPYAYAQRNTLTGEDDTNLYNATVPTNGISLFGFTATGHMIPVIDSVGFFIDLIAIQNYNVGASTNRLIMYDAYSHYADTYGFDIAAGLHFPDEAWGPHFEYSPANVADIANHIKTNNGISNRTDGVFIWQALLSDANSSAYSYLNIASQVLDGIGTATAITNADNWSLDTYGGTVSVNCSPGGDTFCGSPEYDITLNYPTTGTQVHYNCALWTNNWWANPGEYPGQTSGQWTEGSACTEGPGCQ